MKSIGARRLIQYKSGYSPSSNGDNSYEINSNIYAHRKDRGARRPDKASGVFRALKVQTGGWLAAAALALNRSCKTTQVSRKTALTPAPEALARQPTPKQEKSTKSQILRRHVPDLPRDTLQSKPIPSPLQETL